MSALVLGVGALALLAGAAAAQQAVYPRYGYAHGYYSYHHRYRYR